MKSNLSFLLLFVVILLSMTCANQADNGLVLPNGVVISADEKAMLEALTPDAEMVFTKVLGETKTKALTSGSTVGLTTEDRETLQKEIKAMMAEKIGPGYEKYIIEGEYGQKSIVTANDGARDIDIIDGETTALTFRAVAAAKYWVLAWGTWNWADTKHQVLYNNESVQNWYKDTVLNIRAYIKDEVTPGIQKITGNTDFVSASGNMKYGFFPSISTCYTEHEVWDPNIWNSHFFVAYNWRRQNGNRDRVFLTLCPYL